MRGGETRGQLPCINSKDEQVESAAMCIDIQRVKPRRVPRMIMTISLLLASADDLRDP